MAKQSLYPFPVYVATLADGSIKRMSFWTLQGKPMDFARGRRLCAWTGRGPDVARFCKAGEGTVVNGKISGTYTTWDQEHPDAVPVTWLGIDKVTAPHATVIAGHVEWNDERFEDPAFQVATVTEIATARKPTAKAALRLLLEALEADGDITQALEIARSIAA